MKIVISESQLKKIIKENHFSIYDLGSSLNLDEFIENDDFKKDHSNDLRRYLFIELNKVKKEFKELLRTPLEGLTQREIMWEMNLWVNRLKSIRLIIEPEFNIIKNAQIRKNTEGVFYYILRIFSINPRTGKKEKIFSRKVGDSINNPTAPDEEYVNEGKRILENEIWEKYKETYNT